MEKLVEWIDFSETAREGHRVMLRKGAHAHKSTGPDGDVKMWFYPDNAPNGADDDYLVTFNRFRAPRLPGIEYASIIHIYPYGPGHPTSISVANFAEAHVELQRHFRRSPFVWAHEAAENQGDK